MFGISKLLFSDAICKVAIYNLNFGSYGWVRRNKIGMSKIAESALVIGNDTDAIILVSFDFSLTFIRDTNTTPGAH